MEVAQPAASPSIAETIERIFQATRDRDAACKLTEDRILLERQVGGSRWRLHAVGSVTEPRWGVTPAMVSAAVAHCLAVIAQNGHGQDPAAAVVAGAGAVAGMAAGSAASGPPGSGTALEKVLQAITLLDLLCSEDLSHGLVPRVFPALERLFQRTVNAPAEASGGNGGGGSGRGGDGGGSGGAVSTAPMLVALLQFFFDHGETVLYDSESSLQAFFRTTFVRHYGDATTVSATISFLVRNRNRLVSQYPSILHANYNLLLKGLAWSNAGPDVDRGFLQLVPAMVAPSTLLAFFHALLDLPCLVLAMEWTEGSAMATPEAMVALMEAAYMGVQAEDSAHGGGTKTGSIHRGQRPAAVEAFYLDLLDDSSKGAGSIHWHNPSLPSLLEAEASLPPSDRLLHACQVTPRLLRCFSDVALSTIPISQLVALVPAIFARIGATLPATIFQDKVTSICIDVVLAAFARSPSLVATLRTPIADSLAQPHATRARSQLALHLCWAVGEYAGGGSESHEAVQRLFETLELLLYENLSAANIALGQRGSGDRRAAPLSVLQQGSASPLLSVVVTAMAKLATAHPQLAPRARVCLAKVARCQGALDTRVGHKVRECLALMSEPLLAAALFWGGVGSRAGDSRRHVSYFSPGTMEPMK